MPDSIHHRGGLFVDGGWHSPASTERFDVVDPATEEVIGSVPAASIADIDAAVAAARRAFDQTEWRRLSATARAAHIARLADGLFARRAELARLITAELGCTLMLSEAYEAVSATMSFNYNAALADELRFEEVRQSDLTAFAGDSAGGSIIPMAGKSLVVKEPVGVVACFPAFNFALPAVGQKVGPALLAGCTVVLKVPEPNPLACFVLGDVMEEVGFPGGVLNIIAAGPEASAHLVSHPGVDMVSFTGSTEVGSRIGAAAGALVRPVVLELGGKSAAIVLPDADEDVALATMTACSVGTNSGQSCVALTRLLVPKVDYETWAERLAAAFAALKVGDPTEPDTVVGPVVTAAHRDQIEAQIRDAVAAGAKVAAGGGRPPALERGWYLEPTLLTEVTNEMEIAKHETFGPVAVLIGYEDEEDAIRIANDSLYGLSGAVFTDDPLHGFEVARRIRAGTFSVNTFAADLGSPFGGFKRSGIGREHGVTAVEEYLLTKTISVDPSNELPAEVVAGVPAGTGPGVAV